MRALAALTLATFILGGSVSPAFAAGERGAAPQQPQQQARGLRKGVKRAIIAGVVAVGILGGGAVGVGKYTGTYDRLNAERTDVVLATDNLKASWQHRANVLTNKMSVLKASGKFDKDVIASVSKALEAVGGSREPAAMANANHALSVALQPILALAVKVDFPTDTATARGYSELLKEIKSIEDGTQVRWETANRAIATYNKDLTSFWPSTFFSGKFDKAASLEPAKGVGVSAPDLGAMIEK